MVSLCEPSPPDVHWYLALRLEALQPVRVSLHPTKSLCALLLALC